MEKQRIILAAEQSIAREVALGVTVTRPSSIWHAMIPFMFIFDFLKRTGTIRRYSQKFMFPRRHALLAAVDITRGEGTEGPLKSSNLQSSGLPKNQMALVNLLKDHYVKLLEVDGDTYGSLVRNAYRDRGDYEAFLSRLAQAEMEVVRVVIESSGERSKLREIKLAEQVQLEKQRKKRIDEIF